MPWQSLPVEEKANAINQLFEHTRQIYRIHVPEVVIRKGLEHRLHHNRQNWQLYLRGRAVTTEGSHTVAGD